MRSETAPLVASLPLRAGSWKALQIRVFSAGFVPMSGEADQADRDLSYGAGSDHQFQGGFRWQKTGLRTASS